MNGPWETLLLAWLHDPVDKAVDIRGHFSRALRYAAAVLDREVTPTELKGDLADQLASAYERLPMPDARGRSEELGVQPVHGRLTVFHPLSAEQREIDITSTEREIAEVLRALGVRPRNADLNCAGAASMAILWSGEDLSAVPA